MSNICILADRLYVPEACVRTEHLGHFIYKISNEDETDYSIFEGYQERVGSGRHDTIREVRTFNKIFDTNSQQVYYGFSRGNLPKIGELFGEYQWDDRTAAPKMEYPLQFRADRRLLTYKESGRGQHEAVTDWLKHRYGVLRAAPRFGKSVAAVYIATKLGLKTLIVAHQIDLLRQFYKEFDDFTNVNEIRAKYGVKITSSGDRVFFPKDATGMVVGFFNEHKNPEKLDVCLLSWQKFASKYGPERLEKFSDTWGLVILDEAHRGNSLKYAGVLNKFNSRYRLGLTGTVERCDGMEFIVKDIIGPVTAEGNVVQLPCYVTTIKTGFNPGKINPNTPLPWIYKKFYKDKKRTDLVLKWLEKDYNEGNYICVAFHPASVQQLQEFTERLNFEGMKAEAFYGGVPNRDNVLKRAASGETRILVCNMRMLTGINIPCWNVYYNMFPSANVVFDADGRLSGNHYQNFSRIRTPHTYADGSEKTEGIIREFLDDVGMAIGMYKKREAAYKNQGFTISYVNVEGRTSTSKRDLMEGE